jgi:hypothetical protein
MSDTSFFFKSDPPTDPAEYQRWLDGIVRLTEGARMRGVHPETLKRDAKAKDELLQLGRRAIGVRRRFALMLDCEQPRAPRRRALAHSARGVRASDARGDP